MKKKKVIAIVAHDNRKKDLIEWVDFNWTEFLHHKLICTGTTGRMVQDTIENKCRENDLISPEIIRLKSGPLGGDQQLGALICEEKVDIIIFFWDPMQPQPHDVDVKALLRIAVLYKRSYRFKPINCRLYYLFKPVSSRLPPQLKDYTSYIKREIDQ